MPELVAPALRRLGETARALGCRAELDEVRRLVAEGNGAVRRRDTHGRGGMPALLRSLRAVALTDAPAPALTAA
jgi:gamma-glutamyl:cysteine ligase YbdK (ATP-grasp superfamily)